MNPDPTLLVHGRTGWGGLSLSGAAGAPPERAPGRESANAVHWMRKLLRRVLPLVLPIAWAACQDGTGPSPPSPPTTVATIEITPTEVVLTSLGATEQLDVRLADAEGVRVQNVAVTWRSSAADVAGVDENGLITAIGDGRATITATTDAASAEVAVTVCASGTDVSLAPGQVHAARPGCPLFLPSGRLGDRYRVAVVRLSAAENGSTQSGHAPVAGRRCCGIAAPGPLIAGGGARSVRRGGHGAARPRGRDGAHHRGRAPARARGRGPPPGDLGSASVRASASQRDDGPPAPRLSTQAHVPYSVVVADQLLGHASHSHRAADRRERTHRALPGQRSGPDAQPARHRRRPSRFSISTRRTGVRSSSRRSGPSPIGTTTGRPWCL